MVSPEAPWGVNTAKAKLAWDVTQSIAVGAVNVVWQPVAQALDLAEIVFVAIPYNVVSDDYYELTGFSNVSKAESGADAFRAAFEYNPIVGVGFGSYDATTAAMSGDYTGAAINGVGTVLSLVGVKGAKLNKAFSRSDVVIDSVEETSTVFRVQGGIPPKASRNLVEIDVDGNSKINKTTLNVSIGDLEHDEYFKSLRLGSEITSFEIPKWMDKFIQSEAIQQANYKSNPLDQDGLAPKIVDPTTPGRSYELPSIWA